MRENTVFTSDNGIADVCLSIGSTNIFESMQIHPYYEIYYFIDGNAEYVSATAKRKLFCGNCVILPPGRYHRFHVLSDPERYERCVINVYPNARIEKLVKEATKGKEILELSPDSRTMQSFENIIKMIRKADTEDIGGIIQASVTDILYSLKYTDIPSADKVSEKHTTAAELMSYINSNYTDALPLDTLAQSFNYSVSHITHLFKNEYGISIKKYILQKRLSLANRKISEGKKAVDVYKSCGFSDYSVFFRAYKKAFGHSPSAVTHKQ